MTGVFICLQLSPFLSPLESSSRTRASVLETFSLPAAELWFEHGASLMIEDSFGFMKTTLSTFFLTSLIFLLSSTPRYVSAATTDADGDGVSDYALVDIKADGSLGWGAENGGGARSELGSWGRIGDHLVPGAYSGPSRFELASVRPVGEELLWDVRTDAGKRQFNFGTKNQTIVGGADFDGGGTADIGVVGIEQGRLKWNIVFNPVTASARPLKTFTLGRRGDHIFYIRSGRGDCAAALPKKGGKVPLSVRCFSGRARALRLGRIPSSSLTPIPLLGRKGEALLALPTFSPSGLVVEVVDPFKGGRRVGKVRFPHAGTILVGDFSQGPGDELAVQTLEKDGFLVTQSLRGTSLLHVRTSTGIAVDEYNVNSFIPDSDPTLPPPGECVVQSPRDGNEGFLWKPISDTRRFAVTLLPATYTGKVEGVDVLTKSGELIKSLPSKGVGNGNRTHWQDYEWTGPDYRRLHGEIQIRARLSNGSCLLYPLEDPSRRID